jgi:Rha family phage regulatory protein
MSTSPKLKVINGKPYATSMEIARRFNKAHKNVLRDIERTISGCSEEFNRLNFEPVKYKDAKGEMRPCFDITRDGFAILAMGFTGREAMVWKEAFLASYNEMEAELNRRRLKAGHFEQMHLFPGLEQTIDASRPLISISAAKTIIAYQGLNIPVVTGKALRGLVKRGVIEGFFDGRNWQMYQDSFEAWLRNREQGMVRAA